MKKLNINQIKNPTSVTVAAQRLEISQGAIWILIRQDIVPVALRGLGTVVGTTIGTVVDYDVLQAWLAARPAILEQLRQVRTSVSPHPLVTMFAPKEPVPTPTEPT